MKARSYGLPHTTQTHACAATYSITLAITWSLRGHSVALSSAADPKKYRDCRWQYCKEERNGSVGKGGEGEGIGEDYLCCKRS